MAFFMDPAPGSTPMAMLPDREQEEVLAAHESDLDIPAPTQGPLEVSHGGDAAEYDDAHVPSRIAWSPPSANTDLGEERFPMQYGITTHAQNATPSCRPAQVIPLTATEPAAKLVIDAPLAGPLDSRGVVVIPYCAENMHIVPIFGSGALAVSPRVGHIHVTVDQAPWHWADASGNPLILRGLPPGPHTVLIELVDANHQVVDKGTVKIEVPAKSATRAPS